MRMIHREREIETCGCITVHSFITCMFILEDAMKFELVSEVLFKGLLISHIR